MRYMGTKSCGRAGRGSHLLRKVDIRLPGKRNSNAHGARPVHQIISLIEWVRTNRLSIKNSLSSTCFRVGEFIQFRV